MSFILLGILNAQAAGAPAGAGDYDLLETTTLGTATASVTFSGLDSYTDYKHLQIRMVGRTDRNDTLDAIALNFNNDTGSNYAYHQIQGASGNVSSFGIASQTSGRAGVFYAGASAGNEVAPSLVDILDFSSSTKNTTVRVLSGNNDAIRFVSSLYNSTNAITEIDLTPVSGTNFYSGSRFSLYGFKETV